MAQWTLLQSAALYVAINAVITLVLAINVARLRGKYNILIGDGGNETVLRAIRAHANNVEYVPLVLLMLVTLALLQASAIILHVVGLLLAIGRVLHGIGLNLKSGVSVGRAGGTALTFIAFVTAVVALFMKVLA